MKSLSQRYKKATFCLCLCTGELQPLDLSVNGDFKALMKQYFADWYVLEVENEMRNDQDASRKIDLKLSTLKPRKLVVTSVR